MSPILTIAMPVFGKKELVAQMIDSIRANDFEAWQLLAIDDGSPDDTPAWLTARYKDDPRITILRRDRQPKGAQTCRNIGLEKAQGRYIIWFDSDDRIMPYCLRQRVEAMEARPECDFLVFPSYVIKGDKDVFSEPEFTYGWRFSTDVKADFARRRLPFVVVNNIYRIASLRRSGLVWDEELRALQDADFNIHALWAGLRYDFANGKPDYGYRIGYSTATVSSGMISADRQASHLRSIDRMYGVYTQHSGSAYHRALLTGVFTLCARFFANGVTPDFARGMVAVVKKHDQRGALLLRLVFSTALALGHVMPKKRARQVAMLPWLIGNGRWVKRKSKLKINN